MFTTLKRLLKNGFWKHTDHFDDGDLLQSASPKTLVFNYTCFGLCVMYMAPLLMLIDSFKRKGIAERESIKYLAENKRLEMSNLGI